VQRAIVAPLARGVGSAALPSLLLHGPAGSGKTAFARALAAAVAGRVVELTAQELLGQGQLQATFLRAAFEVSVS
jgi:replication-associated recombination protein RarA